MSDIVIFLGPFSFPNGGAAARRILGISKTLQAARFEVKVACGQIDDTSDYSSKWYEGIEVFSLNERTAESLPRQLKHLAYIAMGRKTITWLDSLNYRPHSIVLYSGYTPYLMHLIPWARRNKVRLLFDAVEWYEPASFLGWLSPYQLNIELAMRFLLPRVGHLISISDYLHRYYSQRGCQSVIVPPTLDVLDTSFLIKGRDKQRPLQLVYAGTPGRKDLLNNIIDAVLRLRHAGHALQLSVAGTSVTDAQRYPAVFTRTNAEVFAGVKFLGLLNHEESIDLVRKADFTLLLRRDARYSRAGFPTKFVESLAVGTPVIANLTSDLHRYLLDNQTGLICQGPKPENLEISLLRALSLSQDQHEMMRVRCREMALKTFDYRAFVVPLRQLFQPN